MSPEVGKNCLLSYLAASSRTNCFCTGGRLTFAAIVLAVGFSGVRFPLASLLRSLSTALTPAEGALPDTLNSSR